MTDLLDVWLGTTRIGKLHRRDPKRMVFSYNDEVVESTGAGIGLLSLAMPTSEQQFSPSASRTFFDGVLPEDIQRKRVCELLRIPFADSFALLRRLGAECAGAVIVVDPSENPLAWPTQPPDWIDAASTAAMLRSLRRSPLGIGLGVARLSLAGVQSKTALIRGTNGRWAESSHGNPSTHILKPAPAEAPELIRIECLCQHVVAAAGLAAAHTELLRVEDVETLVSTRYDRVQGDDSVMRRVHQEDMCQVLGLHPDAKYYDAKRWPQTTLPNFTRAIVGHSPSPAIARLAIFDATVANFVLGNLDFHGKNISIVHRAPGLVEVAPLYDVVCVEALAEQLDLGTTLSLPIGGHLNPDDVSAASFARLAHDLGMAPSAAPTRARNIAARVHAAISPAADALRNDGWPSDSYASVHAVATKRSAQLS